jgi:hypothetical protein
MFNITIISSKFHSDLYQFFDTDRPLNFHCFFQHLPSQYIYSHIKIDKYDRVSYIEEGIITNQKRNITYHLVFAPWNINVYHLIAVNGWTQEERIFRIGIDLLSEPFFDRKVALDITYVLNNVKEICSQETLEEFWDSIKGYLYDISDLAKVAFAKYIIWQYIAPITYFYNKHARFPFDFVEFLRHYIGDPSSAISNESYKIDITHYILLNFVNAVLINGSYHLPPQIKNSIIGNFLRITESYHVYWQNIIPFMNSLPTSTLIELLHESGELWDFLQAFMAYFAQYKPNQLYYLSQQIESTKIPRKEKEIIYAAIATIIDFRRFPSSDTINPSKRYKHAVLHIEHLMEEKKLNKNFDIHTEDVIL